MTKTNIVEKSLSTLLIDNQFLAAIKKHFSNVKFDLIMYSTPPITFSKVIKYIKERDQCFSYLLLKDIFPQNAVDLDMMKHGSLIWRYFRHKEKQLYEVSDVIGCMSKANVKYVLDHNPELAASKVEECPNSISPHPLGEGRSTKTELRQKYNIPEDAVVFLYGGNLGRPQGLDFLINILKSADDRKDIFFLIVGSGTDYTNIESFLHQTKQPNALLRSFLPKDDYDELMRASDVGLIFLYPDFTIPNFPSRLTAYMEAALPILAATDVNSDIKDVLAEGECGLWARSGDSNTFFEKLNILAAAPGLRKKMGLAGRRYLEAHYTVSQSYDIITKHLK